MTRPRLLDLFSGAVGACLMTRPVVTTDPTTREEYDVVPDAPRKDER